MTASNVQYISNEQGEVTAVVLPIDLWREITSELETDHLRRSDTMRRRLLEAMRRDEGVPLEQALEKLELE